MQSSASHSRMPLRYNTSTFVAGCVGECDAHATVQSLMATLHIASGRGFQQVVNLSAGVIRFSDFEADDSGVELPPESDLDPSFGVGLGIGYAFGTRSQLFLVQDVGLTIHSREGLSGNESSMVRSYVTRIGFRMGLGSRGIR